MACVNGARWVQQHILETHPGAPLKVYAVSYAMYGADARDRWRAAPLVDRRVQHWWDERRVLGRHLLDALRLHQSLRAPGSKVFSGPVLWDAYLLFDRRAHWGTTMPTPVSWGYTILAAKDSLATQVREQLRRPKARKG